jgi:hypothetical protein
MSIKQTRGAISASRRVQGEIIMDTGTIFAVGIPAIIGGIILFVLYSRRQHQRNMQAITIKDPAPTSKKRAA